MSATAGWKWLLGLFFVLVVIDGALRKWVAPGLSTPLLLLKDGILGLALVAYVTRRDGYIGMPQSLHRTLVPLLLGLYAFWVVLQTFNPSVPNTAVRVLGIRSHILYTVLLLLVPAALYRAHYPLRWLKRYIKWVAVPVLLLGIVQFFQPPSHWINAYVGDAASEGYVATAGGRARITGTFSYIAGMTTFLSFNMALGTGVGLAGLWFRRKDFLWWGSALLALSLIVGPMNGSRGLFFFLALPFPFVVYQILKKPFGRGRIVAAGLTGLIVVGLVVWQTSLGAGYEAFLYRVETAGDADTRVQSLVQTPLNVLDDAGLLGYGVGTNHQAALRLMSGTAEVPRVENRIGSLILELGILGYLLFLALHISLLRLAYQLIDTGRSPFAAALGITALLFGGAQLLGGMVYNVTTGGIYWGLMGLVIAVWSGERLPKQRRRVKQSSSG